MNDFIKNMAQAIFNQDKINDLLRKELQQGMILPKIWHKLYSIKTK